MHPLEVQAIVDGEVAAGIVGYDPIANSQLTAAEIAHCRVQGSPAESFAGRWCAKEAVVKAFAGRAIVGIRDVEIRADERGTPIIALEPRLRICLAAAVIGSFRLATGRGKPTPPAPSTSGESFRDFGVPA